MLEEKQNLLSDNEEQALEGQPEGEQATPREGEPQEAKAQEGRKTTEEGQELSPEELRLALVQERQKRQKANREAQNLRQRLRETEKALEEAKQRIAELERKLAEGADDASVKQALEEREKALQEAEQRIAELESQLREVRVAQVITQAVANAFEYPDIAVDLVKKHAGEALYTEEGEVNEEALRAAVDLVKKQYPKLVKQTKVETGAAEAAKTGESVDEDELLRRYPALNL